MELVSTILALALKIAEAVETAHKNKAMCLDLADRVRTICDILRKDRDSGAIMTAGGGDSQASQITRGALGRLKAALDEALKLVESQRQSGVIERAVASFTADVAGEFQRLHTKISDCVNDLKYAKVVAADHRAQDDNRRADPLKRSPLRPSDLMKQLQPSPLLKPSPPQLQPSPQRPSDLVKQLQRSPPRPSDLVKQLQPSPQLQRSPPRPSDLVKQLQPSLPRPSDLVKQLQPSPPRPSDLVKQLQPSPLLKPSPPRPSDLVKQLQPSPPRPSDLVKQLQRPSDLMKPSSQLDPSRVLKSSPLRPSLRLNR